jgi:hypothetical protein
MTISVRVFQPSKKQKSPFRKFFMNIEGKKEKNWHVKNSTYKIYGVMLYFYVRRPSPVKKDKFKKRFSFILKNQIYSGYNANLQRNVERIFIKKVNALNKKVHKAKTRLNRGAKKWHLVYRRLVRSRIIRKGVTHGKR